MKNKLEIIKMTNEEKLKQRIKELERANEILRIKNKTAFCEKCGELFKQGEDRIKFSINLYEKDSMYIRSNKTAGSYHIKCFEQLKNGDSTNLCSNKLTDTKKELLEIRWRIKKGLNISRFLNNLFEMYSIENWEDKGREELTTYTEEEIQETRKKQKKEKEEEELNEKINIVKYWKPNSYLYMGRRKMEISKEEYEKVKKELELNHKEIYEKIIKELELNKIEAEKK